MMTRLRAAALGLVAVLAGGCHGSLMSALSTPTAACGDPCAAMVCPSGSRCSWSNDCQPRCEPQPDFGH